MALPAAWEIRKQIKKRSKLGSESSLRNRGQTGRFTIFLQENGETTGLAPISLRASYRTQTESSITIELRLMRSAFVCHTM